jgi:hypothetical protein
MCCLVLLYVDVLPCATMCCLRLCACMCDYVLVCATMSYYVVISETMCYYVLLCVTICNYV